MSSFGYLGLKDELGVGYGVKHVSNKPRVSSMSYLYDIAEGNVSGHTPWSKIGYNPAVATTEEDVWSAGGVYVFPTEAAQWQIAAGNAADLGTVIKGNAEGAAQSILCDAGGTTTELNDADVDFTGATAVEVGDIVLISPKGDGSTAALTPEWGYVTAVAATKLTFAGGLSSGGTCAVARAYTVVDQDNGTGTGAQVVRIDYLTSTYAERTVLVALGGEAAVPIDGTDGNALTDTYRVNSFRVIAVGTGGVPVAPIQLRLQAAPNTVYSYISTGFTRARNSAYTVPYGKTLYVTQWNVGASTPNDTKVQTCRVMTRANVEPSTGFRTNGIFYGYTEFLISNGVIGIEFTVPTKLVAGTDIKVSAVGLTGFSGPVTSALRGWLE